MPPGKAASQACHAAKNCVIQAARHDPDLLDAYQGEDFLGTQVVLVARNELALLKAHQQALDAGLITSLIVDKDHVMLPHFTGAPITTALGIGPCTRTQVHAITKRFSVL